MLPSKGLRRVLALIGYVVAILGTVSTGSVWVGSKLAWASDIAAINKTMMLMTDTMTCNSYKRDKGEIETRELILTGHKSQLDAMRQANIRLTPVEIQRYNDVTLALGQLADSRRTLKGAEACR